MARDLETLTVSLEARIKSFEKEMARARQITDRQMRGIEKSTSTLTTRLNAIMANAGKGITAGLGALGVAGGLSLAAIFQGAQQAAAELAAIGDAADKIGITAEALAGLQFASSQAGGSAEAITSGLTRFAAGLADASAGGGELLKILQANNVAFQDTQGKILPTTQLLERYADLVKNARTPQEALELAIRAFGRSAGPDLVPLLSQGAEGIRNLVDEARRSGAVLDNEMYEKAKQINDEFEKIATVAGTRVKGAIVAAVAHMHEFYKLAEAVRAKFQAFGNSDIFNKIYQGFNKLGLADMNGVEPISRFDQTFAIDDKARANAGSMAGYKPPATPAAPVVPKTVLPRLDEGGGGGGKSAADRLVESYARLREAGLARINDLRAEQDALGLATGAAEALRFEQELLNRAAVAGIQLTPAQKNELKGLAQQYGELSQAVEQAAESQQLIQDLGQDALSGFVSDLRQGKSAAEALNNVLDRMLDKVLDLAMNSLFDSKGGGGLLGLLSGLPKLLSGFGGGGLPTMAQGGFGPAIPSGFSMSSAVQPATAAPRATAARPQVVVNNMAGAQVAAREERGPSGDPRVVLDLVKADMAREAGRNGGFAKAIGAPFTGRG